MSEPVVNLLNTIRAHLLCLISMNYFYGSAVRLKMCETVSPRCYRGSSAGKAELKLGVTTSLESLLTTGSHSLSKGTNW